MSWRVQKLGGSLSLQIWGGGGLQSADCRLRVGDGRWEMADG